MGFEVGQEPGDRIIKIEPATFHQGQRSGRHHRLSERRPSKDGIDSDGKAGLTVCVASGARIQRLAVVLHQHHRTNHPARFQRFINHRVDRLLH